MLRDKGFSIADQLNYLNLGMASEQPFTNEEKLTPFPGHS